MVVSGRLRVLSLPSRPSRNRGTTDCHLRSRLRKDPDTRAACRGPGLRNDLDVKKTNRPGRHGDSRAPFRNDLRLSPRFREVARHTGIYLYIRLDLQRLRVASFARNDTRPTDRERLSKRLHGLLSRTNVPIIALRRHKNTEPIHETLRRIFYWLRRRVTPWRRRIAVRCRVRNRYVRRTAFRARIRACSVTRPIVTKPWKRQAPAKRKPHKRTKHERHRQGLLLHH